MEILAKLFGSETKVKLLRLFLFNADITYSISEIIEKSRSNSKDTRKEITGLINVGILKKRQLLEIFITIEVKR